ncbi:MAG: glycogen synthase GlgA [Labilithrix sp.]|nr:glycogen synthase GlgA [Labilithrix sp.]MCW5816485.1 glycogen synthase GlgA [Labilithrix sp.]
MEILFVTTELAPYVKVGGLADVSSALPKTLKALGHRVTVVMPRYAAFEDAGLLLARRLTPLSLTLGDKTYPVTVYDTRLSSQVELTLLEVPGLFDRAGVYGERGEDYPDNAARFAVLSRAAAELAKQRAADGAPFDAVHANDWATALVAKYMKDLDVPTPVVLTIHNVAHQGVFPKEALAQVGLGASDFTVGGIEFYGGINLLKQGILSADVVTTVSTTYAREIQTAELGHRLDGVLRAKGRIVGIVNGVDYGVWNPATDSNIAARFDAEDASNKARCKGALKKELGFAQEPDVPIVASVGRVVHQKGSDLLAEVVPRVLRGSDCKVVIAGAGDEGLMAKLDAAAQRSHGNAVYLREVPEAQVHRIFAGADVVLVPSRFEPCGLVQLYAQRYGALPVARATGGLVDTVIDCDAKLETGTGFLYEADTADALYGAVQRALAAYTSPRWSALRRRVMRLDRGWERAARQYEQTYKSLKPLS